MKTVKLDNIRVEVDLTHPGITVDQHKWQMLICDAVSVALGQAGIEAGVSVNIPVNCPMEVDIGEQ